MRIHKIKSKAVSALGPDIIEFFGHAKNYVTGGIFLKGLAFFTIPIYTRLLIPADYGVLAVFGSIVTISTIILGLGFRGAISRYYFEETNDFKHFFGANVLFIFAFCIIVSLVNIKVVDFISIRFNVEKNIVFFALLLSFFAVFTEMYITFLETIKRSRSVAIINVSIKVLTIITSIFLILQLDENRYLGNIYGQSIIGFFFFTYVIYKLLQLIKINFNWRYIKYSLVFSLPIVVHLLSQYVLASSDILIINQLKGEHDTGLYSLAYSVGMLLTVVSGGMASAYSPMFYKYMNDNSFHKINNLADKYSKVITFVAIGLILFAKPLILLLAEKSYHTAFIIIPIVVIGYFFFFLYTLYIGYVFYQKKTFILSIITVASGLINISLNYLLIPRFGYVAAAYSTMISYFFLFILHYLNVKLVLRVQNIIPISINFMNVLVIVIATAIFFIVNKYIVNIFFELVIEIMTWMFLSIILIGTHNIKKGLKVQ